MNTGIISRMKKSLSLVKGQESKVKGSSGFTLLELLIVIAIIAILSVILVLVLNPAETLKKSRDAQRISDLATLKTALGIIVTSSTTPLLSGTVSNSLCKGGSGQDTIWYSLPISSAITDTTLDGTTGVNAAVQVSAANGPLVNGNGWIPVNFSWLSGGSPISNLPLDPVNTISTLGTVANTDLVYRYACNTSDITFEFGAVLESAAYVTDDPKMSKDGGNNSSYYEVGTKLDILDGATNQY